MNGKHVWRGMGIVAAVVMLAACAAESVTPTGAASPVFSPEFIPTRTSATTPTSTTSPYALPEPVPFSETALAALLPDDASARLGIGTFRVMLPSPDQRFLAVGGDVGIHLFEIPTFRHLWSTPTERPVAFLA